MKKIQVRSGGRIQHGWLNRWAGHVLGGLLFAVAAAPSAWAEAPLTQQQYLQSLANLCGESLPASASAADWIRWAQAKGMNPAGGWNLNARLTKEATAQTLVQLLKLEPGKFNVDPTGILEREGIVISSSGGYVTAQNLRNVISNGLTPHVALGQGLGHDDDGSPSPTRPGNGYGDKNHEHTGPPGQGGKNK